MDPLAVWRSLTIVEQMWSCWSRLKRCKKRPAWMIENLPSRPENGEVGEKRVGEKMSAGMRVAAKVERSLKRSCEVSRKLGRRSEP